MQENKINYVEIFNEIFERSQDFTKEMQFIKQIRPKYNNHGIL